MPYQHKKRKIRRHRQPDRVAMALRKRLRKMAERDLNPYVRLARIDEQMRQAARFKKPSKKTVRKAGV